MIASLSGRHRERASLKRRRQRQDCIRQVREAGSDMTKLVDAYLEEVEASHHAEVLRASRKWKKTAASVARAISSLLSEKLRNIKCDVEDSNFFDVTKRGFLKSDTVKIKQHGTFVHRLTGRDIQLLREQCGAFVNCFDCDRVIDLYQTQARLLTQGWQPRNPRSASSCDLESFAKEIRERLSRHKRKLDGIAEDCLIALTDEVVNRSVSQCDDKKRLMQIRRLLTKIED